MNRAVQAGRDIIMETVRVEWCRGAIPLGRARSPASVTGSIWFARWLFTIGNLHLPFWKGVLPVVLWPYYLGTVFSSMGR